MFVKEQKIKEVQDEFVLGPSTHPYDVYRTSPSIDLASDRLITQTDPPCSSSEEMKVWASGHEIWHEVKKKESFMTNRWLTSCLVPGRKRRRQFQSSILPLLLHVVVLKDDQHHVEEMGCLPHLLLAVELKFTGAAWGANMQHPLPHSCLPPLLFPLAMCMIDVVFFNESMDF